MENNCSSHQADSNKEIDLSTFSHIAFQKSVSGLGQLLLVFFFFFSLFLVGLGLCFCTGRSLVVVSGDCSLVIMHRLLIAVASLVVEHGL